MIAEPEGIVLMATERKSLVLGGTGLLGGYFVQHLKQQAHAQVFSLARRDADLMCDITDKSQLTRFLDELNPDLIINCCALIDFDACERSPESSWNINVEPLFFLKDWLRQKKCKLVHISTDHFYDYGRNQPHKETDPIVFKNTYAKHKFIAEKIEISGALVLRTSVIGRSNYIGKRSNFWEWALDVTLNDRSSTLFHDAYTSSLDCKSFCDVALWLVKENIDGLLNVASSETYSKKQFVTALANRLDLPLTHAVDASVNSLSVKRASCLGLDVSRVEALLGSRLPNLQAVVENLVREENNSS